MIEETLLFNGSGKFSVSIKPRASFLKTVIVKDVAISCNGIAIFISIAETLNFYRNISNRNGFPFRKDICPVEGTIHACHFGKLRDNIGR
ncbi:MAG: hypothetical protein IJ241_01475 [Clostridia bacterium]|nr:hypothetical protein [Clostridia bacterium]